jgi:hypothetical protein
LAVGFFPADCFGPLSLEATMNRRRQLLRAIGLGPLFAGVTAVVPCEGLAANGKSSTAPTSRPEYKVVSLPAGDRIEDILNAFAREGFQFAGSAQRYGQTEFILVKWVSVGSSASPEGRDRFAVAGHVQETFLKDTDLGPSRSIRDAHRRWQSSGRDSTILWCGDFSTRHQLAATDEIARETLTSTNKEPQGPLILSGSHFSI